MTPATPGFSPRLTPMPSISSDEYAGDISPTEAWAKLSGDPKAQMIDVRTLAEWTFVGLADLTGLGRRVHCVEWLGFPSNAPNPGFVEQAEAALTAAGADKTAPILLLCRSGARSRAAAIALTEAGFETCFNVAGGFEGNPDAHRHRGSTNGWKADGLPWVQG